MVADSCGHLLQLEFVRLIQSWGYPNVSALLIGVAEAGSEHQQKRLKDAWVVWNFDVREKRVNGSETLKAFLLEVESLEGRWEEDLIRGIASRYRATLPTTNWNDWESIWHLLRVVIDIFTLPEPNREL